jgi:hypothetical protein
MFRQLPVLIVALILLAPPIHAEMVVITKALPDSSGFRWPREYFNANFAMFVMPQKFMIDNGVNKVPVNPSKTKSVGEGWRRAEVVKAWVNIIDLEKRRFFSGDLNNWFPLDSTEVIRIRAGYDTCAVLMKSCDRPGAPDDSCRTVPVYLNDSLSISDISYIIYTSFDYHKRAKPEMYAKAGYYYRTLLNYFIREIPLGQVADLSAVTDSTAAPAGCNCFITFGPKSVLRVMYRDGSPRYE